MRGSVATATIFKLMSDIWMLGLLPTPFWNTNTQRRCPESNRKVWKYIGEKITLRLSSPKRGRNLGNKMKNIKETSMNEIEGGTRTLNAFTTPWFQVTIYQILRPLFSILDTTILTDFRLHAHSLQLTLSMIVSSSSDSACLRNL